jgi:hypothetical protein
MSQIDTDSDGEDIYSSDESIDVGISTSASTTTTLAASRDQRAAVDAPAFGYTSNIAFTQEIHPMTHAVKAHDHADARASTSTTTSASELESLNDLATVSDNEKGKSANANTYSSTSVATAPAKKKKTKKKNCVECNKAFDSQVQLNDHVAKHSSERPYVCNHMCEDGSTCKKAYIWERDLKRHIRNHHQHQHIPTPSSHIAAAPTHIHNSNSDNSNTSNYNQMNNSHESNENSATDNGNRATVGAVHSTTDRSSVHIYTVMAQNVRDRIKQKEP